MTLHPPFTLQPGMPWVVLRNKLWLGIAAAALILSIAFSRSVWSPRLAAWLASAALVIIVVLLAWNLLVRSRERYSLTDTTATWESGVFRRLRVDVPLDRVQNTVMYRSIGERIFGLGTIGIATAATDGYELVWAGVPHPEAALAAVRAAAARATGKNPDVPQPPPPSPAGTKLPVIGLAGGVGSGKSTVAGIFAELGCLVIDSDQRARAALDRPDVRAQLVEWWGPTVLNAEGRIDRSRVSEIVFRDPQQRQRLEALVHPIVRQDRAAMIAEATGRPVRAVVIDAPLLFEAGLDQECDFVVFLDTPEADRLERVQRTRGWSAEELRRREAAQLPLAQKRARSTHEINNLGNQTALSAAAAALLDQLAPRRSV